MESTLKRKLMVRGGFGRMPHGLVIAVMVLIGGCSGGSSPNTDNGGAGPVIRSAPPTSGGGAKKLDVKLTAAEQAVGEGGSVRLSWTSDNADSCDASGGWSGSKPPQGSAVVGPLTGSTTFTLTCSGLGRNAVAMLSVPIVGLVTLKWQAPVKNVDGTPLTDLSGYRVYYGEQSREYSNSETISDPRAVRYDVEVLSGSYYFAMTALDGNGNESGYSNEVVRVLN
jgi:hypothetical protein